MVAADAYPLVVVESDAIEVSVLHSVESDIAQIWSGQTSEPRWLVQPRE